MGERTENETGTRASNENRKLRARVKRMGEKTVHQPCTEPIIDVSEAEYLVRGTFLG